MPDNNEVDFNSYCQDMETFLLQLRQETLSLCRPASQDIEKAEEWERYLYEISSFYYRSFHQRFFPAYRNSIKQEVSALLKISGQEDMIKNDLMANLRRYARLFNHIKRIFTLLRSWQSENEQQIPIIRHELDRNSLQLLYALKTVQASLKSLTELYRELGLLAGEKELLMVLKKGHVPLELGSFVAGLDRSNPLVTEYLHQLTSSLGSLRNSLRKIQIEDEGSHPSALKLIAAAIEELTRLLDKAGGSLWYFKQQVNDTILLKVELLSMYLQIGDYSKFSSAVQEFEGYLNDLLIIIERSNSFNTEAARQLLPAARQIIGMGPGYSEQFSDMIANTLNKLNKLVDSFPGSGDADLNYFSKQTIEVLDSASPWLQSDSHTRELINIAPLAIHITRINLEFDFLRARVDFLQESQRQWLVLNSRLATIGNILDDYLQYLSDIKADLERLLAPRNLSRLWRDMQVRVDRIPLEKGQLFPAEQIHLLDKHRIETRVSEEPDNTILEEEGDIFIIKIDDLAEEEIPYLAVSKSSN